MKRLALILALLATPAYAADYLVQQPGDTNATGLWKGAQPKPGVDCPNSTRFCLFVIQNKDGYIGNYQIDAQNKQVYAPPVKPVTTMPVPETPLAVQKDLDTTLQDAAKTADDATFLKLLRVKYLQAATQADLDAAKPKP